MQSNKSSNLFSIKRITFSMTFHNILVKEYLKRAIYTKFIFRKNKYGRNMHKKCWLIQLFCRITHSHFFHHDLSFCWYWQKHQPYNPWFNCLFLILFSLGLKFTNSKFSKIWLSQKWVFAKFSNLKFSFKWLSQKYTKKICSKNAG